MSLTLRSSLLACTIILMSGISQLFGQVLSAPTSELQIARISSFYTGEFDASAAEIVSWHAETRRIFFTKASSNELVILQVDNSLYINQQVYRTIDLTTYGGGVNSVAVWGDWVAVAVEAEDKTQNGSVVFFDPNGDFLTQVEVGILPDMVTFTHDGQYAITANEGEPNDDYSIDPEGSVSIISTSDFSVRTASFESFNNQKDQLIQDGVRIYGPGATVAQDLEPEYVTVSPDNSTAFVSLQENNAIAVIDIASATVTDINALGYKDYSSGTNRLDASDRDGNVNIRNWPVFGMYQPDAITSFEVDGVIYLATANEGDAREYDTYEEEDRVKDLQLDRSIFNRSDLQEDENLGRLTISTALADTNEQGEFRSLYTLGGRSFSIWNTETGELVWDSGDELEQVTAQAFPENFNANNDDNDSFESRSDNKGPEPEAITVGEFNGKLLAFVGLERIGGFVVYDITSPSSPKFMSYVNRRNFGILFDDPTPIQLQLVGDLGTEDIKFIDASNSPTGQAFVIVGNEVSGNVSVFTMNERTPSVDIADARTGFDGNVVTVQGIVTTNDYGSSSSGQFFVQDVTGGINVFYSGREGSGPNSPFNKGAEVRITGTIGEFNGQRQISAQSHEVISTGNELPEAVHIIRGQFNLQNPARGKRVSISNVWLVDPTNWPTEEFTFSGFNTLVTNGQDTITVRFDRDQNEFNGSDAPEGIFSISGVFGQFRGQPQIYPFFAEELVESSNENYTLTLFHNNDGESQLIDLGSGQEDFGGVARFKTLADQLRAEAETSFSATLMLSSGDNFLAGPEFNAGLAVKESNPENKFYDALAIEAIGYDALAMGNHDFDFGPDVYADLIDDISLNIPFLSANLDFSAHGPLSSLESSGRIAKSAIFTRNQERIGVIGATTENLPFISSPGVVSVNDVVVSVNSEIAALEAEGINKIILISHLQGIEEDSALVASLTGIDVVIAGGGDEILANEDDLLIPGESARNSYPWIVRDASGNEVPMVTTAGNYSYLGRLNLVFDQAGELLDFSGGPVRVAGGNNSDAVEEDAFLSQAVVEPVRQFLEDQAATIISNSTIMLEGGRSDIRSRETNMGNLVTDSYLWNANRLKGQFGLDIDMDRTIAIANGGGIRAAVSAGDISVLNTFDVLPFTNFLSVIENITPSLLKEIMENAVSRIDPVTGAATGGGTGRFAQIAGFSIKYDPRQPAIQYGDGDDLPIISEGSRIVDILLSDGTPIVLDGQIVSGAPNVNIVTADFTANGGDQYPFRGMSYTKLGITYQQSLESYIRSELAMGIDETNYPLEGQGRIINGVLTDIDDVDSRPADFALNQNYPNPFNPTTTINYTLAKAENVRLAVYNMLGQRVAELVNTRQAAGQYSVNFNASSLSSGMYIYRIEAGAFSKTRKMMLVK